MKAKKAIEVLQKIKQAEDLRDLNEIGKDFNPAINAGIMALKKELELEQKMKGETK